MKCEQVKKAVCVYGHHHRGAIGRELLVGLVAALLCSVLWAIITHYGGRDLIVGAIVIGIVVGIAVALSAKSRSIDNGISAAGMTAIAVLLGKLIIVQWSLTAGMADPTISIQEPAPMAETSQTQEDAAAEDQPVASTATDAAVVPRIHASEMQDISRIKNALSINDLLWLVGAAVAAFIVGIVFSKRKQTIPSSVEQNVAEETPAAEDTTAS